jgi:hypothetical protein
MDYSNIAETIAAIAAIVAILTAVYTSASYLYNKYRKPKLDVQLKFVPNALLYEDETLVLSVTNTGLKPITLLSYKMELIEPLDNKQLLELVNRGFDALCDLDRRFPIILEPNKPFFEYIDVIDLMEPIGKITNEHVACNINFFDVRGNKYSSPFFDSPKSSAQLDITP